MAQMSYYAVVILLGCRRIEWLREGGASTAMMD